MADVHAQTITNKALPITSSSFWTKVKSSLVEFEEDYFKFASTCVCLSSAHSRFSRSSNFHVGNRKKKKKKKKKKAAIDFLL
jgi:hypothetical protein